MKRRKFKQRAWRCIKALVNHTDSYDRLMDGMTVDCTAIQWEELCRWTDVAIEVVRSADVVISGASPLPIIRYRIETMLSAA